MANNKPKRILALDGGGIRGALTLGFLEKIEKEVQIKEGKPNLKLCEYYDLIGGTSTGAIIAAGLAIGKTVAEIKELYLNKVGGNIFGTQRHWWKPWQTYRYFKAEFDFTPLEDALYDVFKEITIGSDEIKTGLCIVTKRADTLSTWPIINSPKGKYFEHNKGILLRDAVRASAAAPTYFVPKQINVGGDEIGTFIDGGISLSNNPALLLFLVATLKGFPYHWELGEDKLSILSIGTGTYRVKHNPDKIAKTKILGWARMMPDMFMKDANYLNQTMLQYLSNSPTAKKIDREILDLKDDLLTPQAALHYIRYNVELETNQLNSLGFQKSPKELDSLREMSHAENRGELYEIGKKAAEEQVEVGHLV